MSFYNKKGYYSKEVPSQKQKILKEFKGVPVECFSGGRTVVISGNDKIREDLINLLSIEQGEEFFNPDMGSGLFDCLFETNDFILRDTIRYKVTEAVVKYIPQIEVLSVDIQQYYDENRIAIKVSYVITSLGEEDEIIIYKDVRENFGGD